MELQQTAKPANRYVLVVIAVYLFAQFALAFAGRYIHNGAVLGMALQIMLVLPVIIYLVIFKKKPRDVFFLNPPGIINALLGITIMLAMYPIGAFLSLITAQFIPNNVSSYLTAQSQANSVWVMLLGMAIIPAIFEELSFRGVVFHSVKSSPRIKIVMSGVLFGLMHMNPSQLLYAIVLGMVLAFIMYYSKSIFTSIIGHCAVNSSSIILLFVAKNLPDTANTLQTEIDPSFVQSPEILFVMFLVMLASLPFLGLLIYIFLKHNKVTFEKTEKKKTKIFTWEFWTILAVYVIAIVISNKVLQ
ncbi:hypothetical protein AGMMS49975_01110 [Clostridia bacterium]|nr:hypothetical protein AGMMS49975_01110 [Clostridia bacterium]